MNFTEEQYKAIAHTEGPLRILASAGSGKTSVLTQKVIRLILEGKARPSQILVLTFTNKAAGEIRERIEKRLFEHRIDYFHEPMRAETFNSFGNAVVLESTESFGLSQGVRLLTEESRWQLFSSILKERVLEHLEITSPDRFISNLARFIESCKENLVTPQVLSAYLQQEGGRESPISDKYYQALIKERLDGLSDLARLYDAYEQLKGQQNLIDYGDQILLPALKLKADTTFRQRYHDRFRYIFVDEYQDTNFSQKEFLLQLVETRQPNVTVVGDDDQAIYGWRGAVVENILNFHQEALFNQQANSLVLSTNFRCSKAVVRAANKILDPFKSLRPEKILKTPDHALEGKVLINSFNSDGEEIAHIGQSIRSLISAGQHPSEIAILCRNKKFFSILARELEQCQVPYQILESSPLLERWEVREMVAHLKCLADDSDDLALVRILRSRRIKLGDGDLYYLVQTAKEHNIPLSEAIYLSDSRISSEGSLRLKNLCNELDQWKALSYSIAIPALIQEINEEVFRQELEGCNTADYAVARQNLITFLETSRRFSEENPLATLADFIQYLEFLGSEEEGSLASSLEETQGVKLLTLHKAKGLEFDVVFLPFLAEKVFPADRSENPLKPFFLPEEVRGDSHYWPRLSDFFREEKVTKKSVEEGYRGHYRETRLREERRLFYVGVTRARKELYLSHSYWIGENNTPRGASIFIRELEGDDAILGEIPLLCSLENPNLQGKRYTPPEAEGFTFDEKSFLHETLLSEADQWVREHDHETEWHELKMMRAAEIQQIKERTLKLWASHDKVPNQFSYSSLITYRECPKLFWFRYLSGLPIFPEREEGNLGKAVHRAIDIYGKNQGTMTNLEDLFSSYNLAKNDLKAAKDYFRTFLESDYGKQAPAALEMGFSLSLPEVASNLIGRIDRVQETPMGIEIVDYKTGKPKPLMDESVLLQMGIYALAGRDLWKCKQKSPIINIMFNLSANQIESKIFSEEELSEIKSGIIQTIRSIQGGRFETKPEVRKCSDCSYNRFC